MRSLHPAGADHSVSIRGSRCTALIHPFALEPSDRECSAGVTAQQQWSRRTREKDHLPADSHTRSVRWPVPLRASALKEHFSKRAISLKE